MAFYCFNTDCNPWGEPQGTYKNRGRYLTWPGNDTSKCNECGGVTVVHDNWEKDYRTHDDGTLVTEQHGAMGQPLDQDAPY